MTPCPRPLPSPPCFSTISSDAFASGLRERAVRSGFRPVNPFFAFWGSGMCFLVVFLVMARRMRFARLPDAAVWSAAWFCAAALCRGSVRRRQGVCYVGFCSVYCERLKEHGRVADVERIRRFGSFFLSVAQVRVRGGRASVAPSVVADCERVPVSSPLQRICVMRMRLSEGATAPSRCTARGRHRRLSLPSEAVRSAPLPPCFMAFASMVSGVRRRRTLLSAEVPCRMFPACSSGAMLCAIALRIEGCWWISF